MKIAALVGGALVLGAPLALLQAQDGDASAPAVQTETAAQPDLPEPAPVPEDIPVALLVDLSTGQRLFEREPDRRFVPASVTKVMTAYTAFKLIGDGELNPATRFQISEKLEEEWSGEGSSMFLKAGEQPTVGELILGTTTVSGNDASVALAEASVGSLEAWLQLMNENAGDLGMRDTHFGGANGFPDGGTTYTTADDLATLGEAIVTRYPGLYRRYFGKHGLTWGSITQANHDPVTGRVDGADGLKTGYTGEAGFTFLGSAERNGRRLMMVLAGSPTGPIRDRAARELLGWGFDAFDQRLILPAHAPVASVEVQGGSATSVAVRLPDDLRVSEPAGATVPMTSELRYRGPVQAPIVEGARIATLRLRFGDQPPFDVPLEAAESVPSANPFQRIARGLTALFS